MSGMGTIIAIVITAGVTYFATSSMGGPVGSCTPVTLSNEVKAYIDNKASRSGGDVAQEIAKLMSRVAEMEKRVGDVDKVNAAYESLQKKNSIIEMAIGEQAKKQDLLLTAVRQQELTSLRNQMASVCAGVVVKRDQGQGDAGAKSR